MLKLVYHTATFGAIQLSYTKPVITVGSGPDNDLVLKHPSVEPRHCRIAFQDEDLVVLPPAAARLGDTLTESSPEGQRYAAGDQMLIGEVALSIEWSEKSVGLPGKTTQLAGYRPPGATGPVHRDASVPQVTSALPEPPKPEAARNCYCPKCDKLFALGEVKRLGLVGQREHFLCPVCSAHVEWRGPQRAKGWKGWLHRLWAEKWPAFKTWLQLDK